MVNQAWAYLSIWSAQCFAGVDLFYQTGSNPLEWLTSQDLRHLCLEEITGAKLWQADELGARENVTLGRNSDETAATTAGRNVAHESAGCGR